jgi:hypothetical protein
MQNFMKHSPASATARSIVDCKPVEICSNILVHTAGAIYIFMAISEICNLKREFEKAGGHWSTLIIWAKNHFALSRSDYQKQYEPILYGWKEGGMRYWCGDRDQSDLWTEQIVGSNKLHPTMKPVALLERMILRITFNFFYEKLESCNFEKNRPRTASELIFRFNNLKTAECQSQDRTG